MTTPLSLNNQLCHRFYTLSNAFSRAYRPLLSQLGITYPQYVVLMSLWERDDVPISELVGHTRIDGGAMSLILKKLEKKGFITFFADEKDRRIRRVLLTPFGHQQKARAEGIPEQMRCKLKNITQAEASTLLLLMDKLNAELEDE